MIYLITIMDHACHLDGIIMEFEGEKSLVLIDAWVTEAYSTSSPSPRKKREHLTITAFSFWSHKINGSICHNFVLPLFSGGQTLDDFCFLPVNLSLTQKQNHSRSPLCFIYLEPPAVVYTDKNPFCVRVSLDRPQGTSRGVGAFGGGEHLLFFMLWVKTMLAWAGLIIW